MTFLLVRLLFIAALAFASPTGGKVKRGVASAGSYASSSSSSSADLGGIGKSGSGSGYGQQNGQYASPSSSAISSSSAGSYSGGGGGTGGGYTQTGYPDSNSNAIPYGSGNMGYGYASNYPGYGGGYGGGGGGDAFPFNIPQGCLSGFSNLPQDPYLIHQQIMNNIQRMHEENLRFGSSIGNGAPQGGSVSSYASGNIGPDGGFGLAGVAPPEPGGLNLRFGDIPQDGAPVQSISGNIPPPSGQSYGISTSSQSGSSTINGQTKTFKTSEVTVNDNGKVTTYKSHSP